MMQVLGANLSSANALAFILHEIGECTLVSGIDRLKDFMLGDRI
jgi:hypothetical protein